MSPMRGASRAGALAGLTALAVVAGLATEPPARAGPAADTPASAMDHASLSGAAPADPRPYISWTWTRIVPKPGEPRGWVPFQRDCAVCHGRGPAKPGTRALAVKYRGKLPALLARRTDLSAAYIKYVVRHGVNVMPPFRKTELSDRNLDAIAAYLTRKHRSARHHR